MRRQPELQSVMADIPALADARVLQELAGGSVSDSWLVEKHGKRLVVRMDTPLARKLGLDRPGELRVLETVAAAGIGPDLIWADPAAGVLVTAYIPGPVWSDKSMLDLAGLERLAGTLHRLHSLPAAVAPDFTPAQAALTYARGIGTPAAVELAENVVRLASQLLAPGHRRSLCHNDLVYSNIIDSDPVRLIDWEYAAVGDPLFDLAVVVRHHQLPDAVAQGFLRACLGLPDAQTTERFNAFCDLYDLLSALWHMTVNKETKVAAEVYV
jgi:aminoglycoside phosphotransferase (APT) family kinase protein